LYDNNNNNNNNNTLGLCNNFASVVFVIAKQQYVSYRLYNTFCFVRTLLNDDDYWIGMYKVTASNTATTVWYDGNPSNWKFGNWFNAEHNDDTACVRYMHNKFKDIACSTNLYYTCKKCAGCFDVLSCLV